MFDRHHLGCGIFCRADQPLMHASEDLLVELPGRRSEAGRIIDVLVADESGPLLFDFKSANCGSGGHLKGGQRGPTKSALIWQFSSEEPHVLEVVEEALDGQSSQNAVHFCFPSPLLPRAVLGDAGNSYLLIVISSRGVLYSIKLLADSSHGPKASVLAGKPQVSALSLQDWVAKVGTPNCLSASGGHIAIGGELGAILCVPQAALSGNGNASIFLLQEGPNYLRTFFTRSSSPIPVMDTTSVRVKFRELLLSIHQNGQIRAWDVAKQERLFTEALMLEAFAEAAVPIKIAAVTNSKGGDDVSIIVIFGPHGTSGASNGQQAAIYRLSTAPSGAFRFDVNSLGLYELDSSVQHCLACYDPAWGFYAWILDNQHRHRLSSLTEEGGEGPLACLLTDRTTDGDVAMQAAIFASVSSQAKDCFSSDDVAAYVLTRWLPPGEFSCQALAETLQELGKAVSVEQVKGISTSEIIDFLVTLANPEEIGRSIIDTLETVRKMYKRFWEVDKQPYSVLMHPDTGRLSIVRAGPTLNAMRPATMAEGWTKAPEDISAMCSEDSDMMPQASERLGQAVSVLSNLFGRSLIMVAQSALWNVEHWHTRVAHPLIMALQTRGAPHAAETSQSWSRRRRQAMLQIGQLFGSIPDLSQAFHDLLLDILNPPEDTFPPNLTTTSFAESRTALASFRAAAQAAGSMLQSVLLLIALLSNMRIVAGKPLPEQSLQYLEQEFALQAEAALRQVALCEWLIVEPQTTKDTKGDPDLLMTNLDLGSPSRRQSGSDQTGEESLLAELCMRQHTELETFFGADIKLASLPSLLEAPKQGQTLSEGLLEKVLAVAVVLLSENQIMALNKLLKLASCLAGSPAVKFLQGYTSLMSCKGLAQGRERAASVNDAVDLLFQAARSLAPRPVHNIGHEDHCSRRWLQQILRYLHYQMTGANPDTPEVRELESFEILMTFCEQLQCLEGAASFAQAATQELAELKQSAPDGQRLDLEVREGRVWANLYTYALDCEQYQEAYCHMENNPIPERRLHCLQSLLRTLCEERALDTLTTLPYTSIIVLERNGRSKISTLLEEAVEILTKRAENAELEANPQPYLILADFHAAKGNWRGVAAAHLSFARRMQEEHYACSLLCNQLGAAANALSLVEQRHQWLHDAQPGNLNQASQDHDVLLLGRSKKDLKRGTTTCDQVCVISLKELRRQSSVAYHLSRYIPECNLLPADVAVLRLTTSGHQDAAISLAETVLEGEQQAKAIGTAVSSMATACALRQISGGSFQASQASFKGADHSWEELQLVLERQACSRHRTVFLEGAVEAVLKVSPQMKLPEWLLALILEGQPEKGLAGGPGNPTALLRIYIHHNKLKNAGILALTFLRRWIHGVSDIQRQKLVAAWFPAGLLDEIERKLANSNSLELKEIEQALSTERKSMIKLACEQTSIFEARYTR